MRNSTVKMLFPDTYRSIERYVLNELPHLQYKYFEERRKKEVSELVYAIIALNVVDFRDDWKLYNEQYIQRFMRNFAILNRRLNKIPSL